MHNVKMELDELIIERRRLTNLRSGRAREVIALRREEKNLYKSLHDRVWFQ